MRSEEWKTYRTRFLIKAKQLTSTLSFTDHLGRQHCGRKGDYLVESFDGVLSIAPRQIFEDIYVLMAQPEALATSQIPIPGDFDLAASVNLRGLQVEALDIETIPAEKFQRRRRTDLEPATRIRRKSPQSVRAQRTPSHLSLM
jgi:hypothetical protein